MIQSIKEQNDHQEYINVLVKMFINLKVHKIEIFFGFDFEICIISLLVMSKY